jgi:hypothetical protein
MAPGGIPPGDHTDRQKARYYLRLVLLCLCLVVASNYYYLAINYVEILILQHPILLMYT